MSSSDKLIKTECQSVLSIKRDDDELTVSIKMNGLPDVIIDRIVDVGNELSVPLIMALMKSISSDKEPMVFDRTNLAIH